MAVMAITPYVYTDGGVLDRLKGGWRWEGMVAVVVVVVVVVGEGGRGKGVWGRRRRRMLFVCNNYQVRVEGKGRCFAMQMVTA